MKLLFDNNDKLEYNCNFHKRRAKCSSSHFISATLFFIRSYRCSNAQVWFTRTLWNKKNTTSAKSIEQSQYILSTSINISTAKPMGHFRGFQKSRSNQFFDFRFIRCTRYWAPHGIFLPVIRKMLFFGTWLCTTARNHSVHFFISHQIWRNISFLLRLIVIDLKISVHWNSLGSFYPSNKTLMYFYWYDFQMVFSFEHFWCTFSYSVLNRTIVVEWYRKLWFIHFVVCIFFRFFNSFVFEYSSVLKELSRSSATNLKKFCFESKESYCLLLP